MVEEFIPDEEQYQDPQWYRAADSYQKDKLYLEGVLKVDTPEEINVESIRSLPRPELIRGIAEKNYNKEKFSTDEVKSLICLYVEDRYKAWGTDRELHFKETNSLPWPDTNKTQVSRDSDRKWVDLIVDEDEVTGDAFTQELKSVVNNLDDKSKVDISLFILDNLPKLAEFNSPKTLRDLTYIATNNIDPNNPDSLKVALKSVELLDANRDILETRWDTDSSRYVTPENIFIDRDNPLRVNIDSNDESERHIAIESIKYSLPTLSFEDQKLLYLRAIAHEKDTDKRNYHLGRVLVQDGLITTLNNLKSMYSDPNYENQKDEIEALLRPFWKDITGEAGDFQPDVVSLYEAYGYEDYDLTAPELVKRDRMLREVLPKLGIKKGAKVLDLACGVGGLTKKLDEMGYESVGVDITPRHIDLASKRYPEITFKEGTWDNLVSIPEAQGSEAVVIDGRSLGYAKNLYNIYDQCTKIGAKVVVHTHPNPRAGRIGRRFETLKDKMEPLGFSRDWMDRHMHDAIGKLGNNLSNRWLKTEELLRLESEASGYEVVDVVKEPDYDGQGSENMVFITRFVEEDGKRHDMMLDAREKLSELQRTQLETPNPNRAYNHHTPDIRLTQSAWRGNR